MGQLDPMNKLAEKYKDRAIFLFIYAREAHPPGVDFVFPEEEDIQAVAAQKVLEVYEKRQASGRLLRTHLAENWHVLIDNYGQQGARPSYMCYLDNPLFVIGTDGKIAKSMKWTNAEELDQFFRTYLQNHHKKS